MIFYHGLSENTENTLLLNTFGRGKKSPIEMLWSISADTPQCIITSEYSLLWIVMGGRDSEEGDESHPLIFLVDDRKLQK